MDGEIKSLIVSGDYDMINEVLKDILVKFKRNGSQKLLSSMSSPNLKVLINIMKKKYQKIFIKSFIPKFAYFSLF
jgi:hypothetical protein